MELGRAVTATEPARLGRQGLGKVLAPLRVKSRTLTLFLCFFAAAGLSGCIPPYTEPEDGTFSTSSTSSGAPSDMVNGQPSSTSSSTSSSAHYSGDSDTCVSIGWPVEEVSSVVGFPLAQVEDIPDGCSYSTDPAPFTTRIEISRRQIPSHASFEAAFAQLATAAAANGTCTWVSPEHLAFTCTVAFGVTQAFEGASVSMVFLNDHAVQFMTGTYDPAFVSWAEAGAWKLAQDARARNL
jgi:hypothetical protein